MKHNFSIRCIIRLIFMYLLLITAIIFANINFCFAITTNGNFTKNNFAKNISTSNELAKKNLEKAVPINANWPYPNPYVQARTAFEKAEQPISDMVYGIKDDVNSQLFANPACSEVKDRMQYEVLGLPASLSYTTTQWFDKEERHYAILTISGTPTATEIGTYHIVVKAHNRYGESAETANFDLLIK
jgi:hypothetical protein